MRILTSTLLTAQQTAFGNAPLYKLTLTKTGETTDTETQPTSKETFSLYQAMPRLGQKFNDDSGRTLLSFTFNAKRFGAPDGKLYLKIWSQVVHGGSNLTEVYSQEYCLMSAISTSATDYTITLRNQIPILANYSIGLYTNTTGDGDNCIAIKEQVTIGADPKANEAFIAWTGGGGTWEVWEPLGDTYRDMYYSYEYSVGDTTYTYTFDDAIPRIMPFKHLESPYSQMATPLLDNGYGDLTGITFKGSKAVLSYGYRTSAGDEYSDTAPLTCIAQNYVNNLVSVKMSIALTLVGIPDLMARDKAAVDYTTPSTSTDTTKTLLSALMGLTDWAATVWTHASAQIYEIVYDSEDSLIDTFIPADSFRIAKNQDRLEKARWLISTTGCVMRVESDGKWHVRVPKTSASAWLYYLTGADNNKASYLTLTQGQTFTTDTVGFVLTSVTLTLYRVNSPGTFTVSIYATDGNGLPTGSVLASGTSNGDTLTTNTAGETREITFTTPLLLSASTKYAIVLNVTTSVSHRVHWRADITSPSYTDGAWVQKIGEEAWEEDTSVDLIFQCNGYHYQYSLSSGYHTFLSKSYHKGIPQYGYVQVDSRQGDSGDYTGNATDTDTPAALRKPLYITTKLASDAQATLIATAKLLHYQIDAEKGQGTVPMNVGAEVYDYVQIVDSLEGDSREGNSGQLVRYFAPNQFNMSFALGMIESGTNIMPMADEVTSLKGYVDYRQQILELYEYDRRLAEAILTILTKGLLINAEYTFAAGYDPNTKRRVFTTTPTTPYDVGDLWLDASVVKRCTTARASGAYQAGDWTATTLDAITDGSTYKRVYTADFSADHILLSSTIQAADYRTVSDTEKAVYVGKAKVFRQTTEPATGMQAGDFWIDTTGNYDLPYTYSGAAWIATYTYISGGYIKTGVIDAAAVNIQTGASGDRAFIDSTGLNVYGVAITIYNAADVLKGYLSGAVSGNLTLVSATAVPIDIIPGAGAPINLVGDVVLSGNLEDMPVTPASVIAARELETTYQNTGDSPLFVAVTVTLYDSGAGADVAAAGILVGSADPPTIPIGGVALTSCGAVVYTQQGISAIVPVGWYYRVNTTTAVSGTVTKAFWSETKLGE